MKTINLPIETAREMYTSNITSLVSLALANYTKEELEAKELPKSWEELHEITGNYVDGYSNIQFYIGNAPHGKNKNTFATKEQAQASLALAQLSQLMKVYNDGWIPDWTTDDDKWCICIKENIIITDNWSNYSQFLTFKTRELRNTFLRNFKDLIEQAKPLL